MPEQGQIRLEGAHACRGHGNADYEIEVDLVLPIDVSPIVWRLRVILRQDGLSSGIAGGTHEDADAVLAILA